MRTRPTRLEPFIKFEVSDTFKRNNGEGGGVGGREGRGGGEENFCNNRVSVCF